ncbi:hypothetical protein E2C01_045613 [Portunus trituberculatus]|uniref:Uncharacterized protein n=1 Tax=Portunus trituberculatus TaxID=210409 RepID=A0A5B7FVL2_PORTR|nr:hypothetical protein [Portunus trituberculatus]
MPWTPSRQQCFERECESVQHIASTSEDASGSDRGLVCPGLPVYTSGLGLVIFLLFTFISLTTKYNDAA